MSDGIDMDGRKTDNDKEWRAVWKNPICFYTHTLYDLLVSAFIDRPRGCLMSRLLLANTRESHLGHLIWFSGQCIWRGWLVLQMCSHLWVDKPDKQWLLRRTCVVFRIRGCCFDHGKREIFFFLKIEKLGLQGRRSGVCCSAKFKLGLTL